MVRQVELKLIEDKVSRQACFSKRRNGLLKKAYETSTLCGVDVALLAFSPTGRLNHFAADKRIEDVLTRFINLPEEKRDLYESSNSSSNFSSISLLGPIEDPKALLQLLSGLRQETDQVTRAADQFAAIEQEINQVKEEITRAEEQLKAYEPDPEIITSVEEAEAKEKFIQDTLDRLMERKKELLELDDPNHTLQTGETSKYLDQDHWTSKTNYDWNLGFDDSDGLLESILPLTDPTYNVNELFDIIQNESTPVNHPSHQDEHSNLDIVVDESMQNRPTSTPNYKPTPQQLINSNEANELVGSHNTLGEKIPIYCQTNTECFDFFDSPDRWEQYFGATVNSPIMVDSPPHNPPIGDSPPPNPPIMVDMPPPPNPPIMVDMPPPNPQMVDTPPPPPTNHPIMVDTPPTNLPTTVDLDPNEDDELSTFDLVEQNVVDHVNQDRGKNIVEDPEPEPELQPLGSSGYCVVVPVNQDHIKNVLEDLEPESESEPLSSSRYCVVDPVNQDRGKNIVEYPEPEPEPLGSSGYYVVVPVNKDRGKSIVEDPEPESEPQPLSSSRPCSANRYLEMLDQGDTGLFPFIDLPENEILDSNFDPDFYLNDNENDYNLRRFPEQLQSSSMNELIPTTTNLSDIYPQTANADIMIQQQPKFGPGDGGVMPSSFNHDNQFNFIPINNNQPIFYSNQNYFNQSQQETFMNIPVPRVNPQQVQESLIDPSSRSYPFAPSLCQNFMPRRVVPNMPLGPSRMPARSNYLARLNQATSSAIGQHGYGLDMPLQSQMGTGLGRMDMGVPPAGYFRSQIQPIFQQNQLNMGPVMLQNRHYPGSSSTGSSSNYYNRRGQRRPMVQNSVEVMQGAHQRRPMVGNPMEVMQGAHQMRSMVGNPMDTMQGVHQMRPMVQNPFEVMQGAQLRPMVGYPVQHTASSSSSSSGRNKRKLSTRDGNQPIVRTNDHLMNPYALQGQVQNLNHHQNPPRIHPQNPLQNLLARAVAPTPSVYDSRYEGVGMHVDPYIRLLSSRIRPPSE